MNLFVNEFFLLNPMALIGLISLLIPILIHLFNPGSGKLTLIGNIDLIKKIKNIGVIEVKINQWLLLLIRLIIFLLLSLLFAELIKQDNKELSKQTSAFITTDWLNNATEEDLAELRKLHEAGPVFMLEPGFEEVTISLLEGHSDIIPSYSPDVGISTLLAELQDRNLVSENTIIYATNRLVQYSTEKAGDLSSTPFDWRIKRLDLNKQFSTSLNITIFYSRSRESDNQYLKLALDTISKISEVKLIVNHYSVNMVKNFNTPSFFDEAKADWIFWLSEDTIPKPLTDQAELGSYLFIDMPGDVRKANNYRGDPIAIKIDQTWTHFYSAAFTQTKSYFKPIWYNRKGQTVLSVETNPRGKIFYFNSRLHPNWNDMVGKVEFPLILAGILAELPKLNEQKLLSLSELAPVPNHIQSGPDKIEDKKSEIETVNTPLRPFLLLAICLLWLIERWLSERRRVAYE